MPDKTLNIEDEMKDVAIIGAGPVGLFTIFQCGMLGLSTVVIDSLEEIGGQCTALYPEKPIYDIPAYPEIMAADLIAQLKKQAAPFKPRYCLNQQIVALSQYDDFWRLKTSLGQEIQAKTIIIAGGAGAFGPNKPPLKGLESYEGRSVFYMVRRKDDLIGKKVIIAGGGDSAVDWALSLAPIAESVRLVHRREKFRAAPDNLLKLQELSQKYNFELIVPYQLDSLTGKNGILHAVNVKDTNGSVRTLEADILLPFYGLSMALGPIADWGLVLDQNHISTQPTTARTNIDSVYAVGDIASYDNKKKYILTGFSEAAFAAHDIYKKLYPETPLHFEYSTTKGLPQ